MIKFICDSTADIPQVLIDELDIRVVPTHLIWGDRDYLDRVDIQQEEFYRRITTETPPYPATSTPTLIEFQEAYEAAIADGASEIVCLPLGSGLSSTINLARHAAEGYKTPIYVLDSLGTTMLTGWQVLAGARLAAQGGSIEEVLERIEETRNSVFVLFGLDSISWISRGGRMRNAFRWLGSNLPIKPVLLLTSEKGKFEAIAIKRTSKGMKEGLLNALFNKVPDLSRCRLIILHGDAFEAALEMKERILNVAQPLELYVSSTGPVVGLNTGPKALGLCAHIED